MKLSGKTGVGRRRNPSKQRCPVGIAADTFLGITYRQSETPEAFSGVSCPRDSLVS